MNPAETSVAQVSRSNPWIARMVMPRAYKAMMDSSKPVKRRSWLGIRFGSKLPSRLRGTSLRTGAHGLGACAIALIGSRLALGRAGGVAQVATQLHAHGALDQRLLEGHGGSVDCLFSHRRNTSIKVVHDHGGTS